MLDADAVRMRAPGGAIGVQRVGEMNAAFRSRAFAGDHAVAHDGGHGQRCYDRTVKSMLIARRSADVMGVTYYTSKLLLQGSVFPCGRKRAVMNDLKLAFR